MTVNKRRKVVKYRGSKTHGGGSMKKRRGSGNRGGYGMAGSGKGAKQKKPTIMQLYGNAYFGKHGFKRPAKITFNQKAINIKTIEKHFNKWLKSGIIKKEGSSFSLDLSAVNADKLLATGNATRKYAIKADFASKNAIAKIEKAGGSVSCAVSSEEESGSEE